ncbi:MAG: cytochrome c [Bacteroidetes bacterium]|nr:MAG: cytochrome c [Bacteroidota bacterium]
MQTKEGTTEPEMVQQELPVRFGFGQRATRAEIAAWDIDVRPDGQGLPAAAGTVAQGRSIYAQKCAACHGPTGKEGPFDVLVGREPREGFPFGKSMEFFRQKTIGNYWPYSTTLYDYIQRAMPQNQPGSLQAHEVYSLVAFLLYQNEIIGPDARLDAQSLPLIRMPARDRFVRDNRQGGVTFR